MPFVGCPEALHTRNVCDPGRAEAVRMPEGTVDPWGQRGEGLNLVPLLVRYAASGKTQTPRKLSLPVHEMGTVRASEGHCRLGTDPPRQMTPVTAEADVTTRALVTAGRRGRRGGEALAHVSPSTGRDGHPSRTDGRGAASGEGADQLQEAGDTFSR